MDKVEEGDFGLSNVEYRTHEDYTAHTIAEYVRIAERYGGNSKVYVGEIIGHRLVYKECCLYATICVHLGVGEFSDIELVDGHLECATILELATVARGLSLGKILVIDRETKQILESRTC